MISTQAEPVADAGAFVGVLDAIGLPDGRTLTVRTVTQADVDGLDALFEGLSDEDRHYRFFDLYHPEREFVEEMTRPQDQGGYRLIAVVSGAKDSLVAEAGYAILPDGDGEFGLTIAAGWRGWLGPYLLDALAAAAAARGVPNLQADILLDNAPMLALVACRDYVTLNTMVDRKHLWEVVRVAIAAAQPARQEPRSRGFSGR